MSSAEDYLRSQDTIDDFLAKNSITANEFIKDAEELKKKAGAMIGIWPPPPPAPTPGADFDAPDIKVRVQGENCTFEKDSNLYFKIVDLISWMIINVVDRNSGSYSLENMLKNGSFKLAIQKLLEKELLTSVTVGRVEIFKSADMGLFQREFNICIMLNINQLCINNYADIETQQMIDRAIGK